MATSGRRYEILMPLSCEVTKPSSSEEETTLTMDFGDRRGRRQGRLEVFPNKTPPGVAIVAILFDSLCILLSVFFMDRHRLHCLLFVFFVPIAIKQVGLFHFLSAGLLALLQFSLQPSLSFNKTYFISQNILF